LPIFYYFTVQIIGECEPGLPQSLMFFSPAGSPGSSEDGVGVKPYISLTLYGEG